MITLSPSAIKQLNIACSSNQSYVRLALRSGGCAGYSYEWSYDDRNEDDALFEIGNYGLIIDSFSQSLLGETTINFIQSAFESSWEIDSAAATGGCGCGKSVFIKQDDVGGCNG